MPASRGFSGGMRGRGPASPPPTPLPDSLGPASDGGVEGGRGEGSGGVWEGPSVGVEPPPFGRSGRPVTEKQRQAEEWRAAAGKKWQYNSFTVSSGEPPLRLPAATIEFDLPRFFPEPHEFPQPLHKQLLFAPNSALSKLGIGCFLSADLLRGLDWPASLQSLTLSCGCKPGTLSQVDWPPSLRELSLRFDAKLELQSWNPPATLTHLDLPFLPVDCSSVRWPPQLQRLALCLAPNISGPFHWPQSLTALELNRLFILAAFDLPSAFLPSTLRELYLPLPLSDHTPQLRLQLSQSAHLRSLSLPLPSGSSPVTPLADLLTALPSSLHSLSLRRPVSDRHSDVAWPAPLPHLQLQLPPALTRLHLPARRLLSFDGWSTLLNDRPNCSVTFEEEAGLPQPLDENDGDAWRMS